MPRIICANFGCQQSAANGWSCCSKYCGWKFNKDMHALKNALTDVYPWDGPVWGILNWSVEKYLYYLSQYERINTYVTR